MEKENKENIGLRPIIVNYLRHWKLILCSGIIGLVLAIVYLLVYPRTYEIMARIQIQENQDMLGSGSIGLGDAAGIMKSFGLGAMGNVGTIVIDDEIVTLYSSRLMSRVVVALGLYAEYTHNPTFWYKMYGEEPAKVTCDSATLAGLDETVKFGISVSKEGKIKIKSKTDSEKNQFHFDTFPAIVTLKQGRFVFDRRDNVAATQTTFSLNVEVSPPSWIAENMAKDMQIEDYSTTSNFIELTCFDYKKQRSKDVLNTLLDMYNEEAYAYKKKLGDASLDFLNGRIDSITTVLSEVERNIELYKTDNKLTDVQYDIQYYAEYMKELQIKLIEAETQSNLIRLMDQFVKDTANKYKLMPSLLASSEAENSPLFLYNQALLERERAIKNSSEDNPMVKSLTLQVDRLREGVHQMIGNAQQSIIETKNNLSDREKKLLGRMGSVPAQERVYFDYKRQQEISQGLYLILLQKREEIILSISRKSEKAKIVDPAFVKSKPIAPRKLYAAIGVCVFTLLLSVGWLFCKDQYLALKEAFQKID